MILAPRYPCLHGLLDLNVVYHGKVPADSLI
jgi:hypothetical protein